MSGSEEKREYVQGVEEEDEEEETVRRPKPGSVTPLGIRTDRGNGLLSSESLQKDINEIDAALSSLLAWKEKKKKEARDETRKIDEVVGGLFQYRSDELTEKDEDEARRDRYNEALKKEVQELNAILGESPLVRTGADEMRGVQHDNARNSKMSDDDVVALMMLAARSGGSETGAARTSAFNARTHGENVGNNTDIGVGEALEANGLHSLDDISGAEDAIDYIGIDIGMDIAHWEREMENVLARMDGLNAIPASKKENEKENYSLSSSYKNISPSSTSSS